MRHYLLPIIVSASIALAACTPQTNGFQGKWFVPTDQATIEINDKEVIFVSPSDHQTYHLPYTLQSSSALAVTNKNGQVVDTFELSQDEKTITATAQPPFGSGTYVMQRVR